MLSVTDTAARFAIPSSVAGKIATFTMDGTDADVVFGGSSVSCTYGQTSGVSSEVITLNAASGGHLKDGIAKVWLIPKPDNATHFSVDCADSGSGNLYVEVH